MASFPVEGHETDFYTKRIGESIIECRITCCRGPPTEFTALFLAVAIVMLIAWRGSRAFAFGLFAAVIIACVATYLHHATDTLNLSF